MIRFGEQPTWRDELVGYARDYAARVESDYREFSAAYDDEKFAVSG